MSRSMSAAIRSTISSTVSSAKSTSSIRQPLLIHEHMFDVVDTTDRVLIGPPTYKVGFDPPAGWARGRDRFEIIRTPFPVDQLVQPGDRHRSVGWRSNRHDDATKATSR